MALTQIKSGAIADDAIDSSTFADGSIDNAHLADDAVDGDKLANNIDVAGTLDVTSAAVFDSTGTFSGDVSIADKIIHTGDTNTALRFPAADTITAETAGSERLRINSSGNVGIGTTSPAQLFHISSGASSTDLRIENGNADFLIQAGNAGDDGLHFYDMDNGAYRMVIDNAGQVGIGTITPSTLLDVNGVATFANTVKIGAVSNYAAAARLEVVGEAATTNDLITSIVVNAKTTGTAANGVGTQMIFLGSMTGQDNVELGRIGFHNNNVSGAHVDFIIKTRPNGTSAERLRITSGGNVGIGTTSPSAPLEVDGVIKADGGIDFSGAQTNLAGMTSETLDAYEEGTYTPSAQNFTVSGTSTLTGQYVKIGRQVTVGIKFANTGTIAHSVSALITLPFAMASGLEEANGLIGMLYNANGTAFNSNQSGTQCKLDGEGGARFFVGSFTTTSSGGQLLFGGTYIAAS